MLKEEQDNMTNYISAKSDKAYTRPTAVAEDVFMEKADVIKTYDGIDANFKRKIARIAKAYQGQEDTGSKQLFPDSEYVTGYGLFDVITPPYNLVELSFFYDNSFANHAAVNAKVSNIVGLGYDFKMTNTALEMLDDKEDDSALRRAQRKIERLKASLRDYLEDLNDEDTFTHTLEKMWTDYEATGNGYLEIGRTVNGEIGYVGHIPATTMRVRRLRDGYLQIVNQKVVFFKNFQDTRNYNPVSSDGRPNEIIHLKKYSPRNTYYGVPDVVSAATAVVGNDLAAKYNVDYFENKAVPRYIVTVKGAKLDENSEDRLFRFLQSGLRGQNHRTLYIPLPSDGPDGKVEFNMEPIESGIQEGSFDKYHKSNRDDILTAHSTPLSKVGGAGGQNIASALAADRTFKEQVARPAQRSLEKVINKIIKEKTDVLEFKLNELSLTDENTQSQIDERYLRTQVIVPNDIRPRLGLPMMANGNNPVVMTAGQRAEQTAQATGNRRRDQQRTNDATDSPSTDSGRNAQGEGRTTN